MIRRSILNIFIITVSIILTGSCARVAPPLPPLRRIPPRIKIIEAHQTGPNIEIKFDLPLTNIDKSPIKYCRIIEVRAYEGHKLPQNKQIRYFTKVIFSKNFSNFKFRSKNRTIRISLNILKIFSQTDGTVFLAIRYQNDRSHWSAISNFVQVNYHLVASSPHLAPSISMDKHAIHVEWEMPSSNFDGSAPPLYDGEIVLMKELPNGRVKKVATLGKEASKVDIKDFKFDTRYAFCVEFFRKETNGIIKSALSPWVEIDTKDVYPPDIPVGLSILIEKAHLKLLWSPVKDMDLKGYLVFRRKSPDNKMILLTPNPIYECVFPDRDANLFQSYIYQVCAVDTHGNKSKLSKPAIYKGNKKYKKNKDRGEK